MTGYEIVHAVVIVCYTVLIVIETQQLLGMIRWGRKQRSWTEYEEDNGLSSRPDMSPREVGLSDTSSDPERLNQSMVSSSRIPVLPLLAAFAAIAVVAALLAAMATVRLISAPQLVVLHDVVTATPGLAQLEGGLKPDEASTPRE